MGNHAMYAGASRLKSNRQAGAQTLPELFRRSGYYTVCIGKISHTPDGRVFAYDGAGDGRHEVPHAWDELATPFGQWKRGWGTFFAYAGGRHREDGENHRDLMEFVAERDEDLPDGMMAEQAITQLRALKDRRQPFFLGLGFYKPHLPFVATRDDWQAMADRDIPPPPQSGKCDTLHWHSSGEFYKYDMKFKKTRPLAAEDQLASRRAYLACVRYVDRQVGKVLDALEELELSDSTIVVVWGDHGWHLGDSAIWGKHTPLERALKSTLIIRAPGVTPEGRQCDALVQSLDLFPTLLDLCQPEFRQTEHPLDGKSLRPLLTGEVDSIHEVVLSYWGFSASVRSPTHRLIATNRRDGALSTELYDIREGPDPVHDRATAEPDLVRQLLTHVPAALWEPRPDK